MSTIHNPDLCGCKYCMKGRKDYEILRDAFFKKYNKKEIKEMLKDA